MRRPAGADRVTLAQWLEEHPGVEVICRDRAGAYAEGARQGAPEAIQCADRWHLWHNLAQAVERSVSRHRSCLHPQATTETVEPPEPQGDKPSHSALKASTRFADRTREKHAKMHALIAAGHSLRSISRQLGMTHRTVGRFAHAATPEVLLWGQWQNKPSMVDDFKPYLQQRWAEGHTNATHLLKEIKALGYRGSYGMLSNYLRPLRTARPVTAAPPTVRKVTGLAPARALGLRSLPRSTSTRRR